MAIADRALQNNIQGTRALQRAVLSVVSKCGSYKQAAELVGISHVTIGRWCRKYPDFKEQLHAAKADYQEYVIGPQIEAVVHQRALAGKDDPQSAVLAMFALKKIDPSYRENNNLHINSSGPVSIQFGLDTGQTSQGTNPVSDSPPDPQTIEATT